MLDQEFKLARGGGPRASHAASPLRDPLSSAMLKLSVTTFLFALSSPSFAKDYTGNYLRQPEGTEYESVFIPCQTTTNEVWHIKQGPAYNELLETYEKTPHELYGEVPIILSLRVTPIDRTKYPQEHTTGDAIVDRVVKAGAGVTCL